MAAGGKEALQSRITALSDSEERDDVDAAELALAQHVLARAPVGAELPVVRRWRTDMSLARASGRTEQIDASGRHWKLDRALFWAFERVAVLLGDDPTPGFNEHAAEPDRPSTCLWCGGDLSPGDAYCYGCGRNDSAEVVTPETELDRIRRHHGAHGRSPRRH